MEQLDHLCKELTSGRKDSSLAAARALRNSCAGNLQNASYLAQNNVIDWIAVYCRETALLKPNYDCNESDDRDKQINADERELFVLALCQFLSNFAACGRNPSEYLWSSSFAVHGESHQLRNPSSHKRIDNV